MTKHTPGPWEIFRTKGEPPFYVIGIGRPDGEAVTDGNVGLGLWGADSPEAEANARLIAAAPDMLAALKLAQTIIGHPDDEGSKIVATAIAKAEAP